MSLLFGSRQQRDLGDTPNNLIPARGTSSGSVIVTPDSALKASAVWASIRLRADLVSTTPLKSWRKLPSGMQVELKPSPLLVDPAGDGTGIEDWLYSSQADLERLGNCIGIIRQFDALGYPQVVELQPTSSVTVRAKGAKITSYRIGSTTYDPSDIWHERQFTIPGLPMGLSAISYAAATIGSYLSAQDFGLQWFAGGGMPTSQLKNTGRTLDAGEADIVKTRFKATQSSRDVFVTGSDWEFNTMTVAANESQFIETMSYGVSDIARFFGVPGDLIDAPETSSAKITYANITQRYLGLLVGNLGPTFVRREKAFSRATPGGQLVKFDTDALLRMDTQTRESMLASMVVARTLAPSEARAIDNRLPFTEDQEAEFDRLFGSRTVTPNPTAQGVPA